MPDFDIPGLGRARMALTLLAKEPTARGDDEIKRAIIHELYPEIRAARLAGHPWKKIRAAILADIKIRISEHGLLVIFAAIDKEYEEKTSVKALPVGRFKPTKKKVGRPRKDEEVSEC